LQRLLAALGALVALWTFTFGAAILLQRHLEAGSAQGHVTVVPSQVVLISGGAGSLLVARFYVPVATALQRRGQNLCEELFASRGQGSIGHPEFGRGSPQTGATAGYRPWRRRGSTYRPGNPWPPSCERRRRLLVSGVPLIPGPGGRLPSGGPRRHQLQRIAADHVQHPGSCRRWAAPMPWPIIQRSAPGPPDQLGIATCPAQGPVRRWARGSQVIAGLYPRQPGKPAGQVPVPGPEQPHRARE
jgi:hypothetical protein